MKLRPLSEPSGSPLKTGKSKIERTYSSTRNSIDGHHKLGILDGEQLGDHAQHFGPVEVGLRVIVLEIQVRVLGVQVVDLVPNRLDFVAEVPVLVLEVLERAVPVRQLGQLGRGAFGLGLESETFSRRLSRSETSDQHLRTLN